MTRWVGMALALACALAGRAEAAEIFVSNEKGNSISIVDGATLELIETVPVGNRPRGIALSSDGRWLYICASDDNTIQVMDTESRQIVAQLPSGPDPELLVVSPDDALIYVANEDDNMVTVIDVASKAAITQIPVGVEPEGMGVSHDGKWIVNTSETTNMAHFINADTLEITDNVLVDQRPRFAEWTSDDAEIWVSAEIGGTVSVIDNATRRSSTRSRFEIAGVPAKRSSRSACASPTIAVGVRGARPRQPGRGGRRETFEVEDYLLTGQRVWQLALSPDEKFLYATNGVSNDISVIDVDNLEVVKSVAVGRLPWGVAVKG